MIRRLCRFLKPLLLAVLALAVLPCVVEFWLRWQEFRIGRPILSGDPQNELLTPSWLTHHQLKPSRQITLKDPDTGEVFDTQTNSFGLRGPEPVIPKPHDTIRIVVLGDETILGLEVADAETFTAHLQELLTAAWQRPVEVINAAVPGDCALISALRLRHELAALRPDLVICHFDMSDVADDYSLRRLTVLGRNDEPLACPHPQLEKPVRGVGEQVGDHFLVARLAERKLANFWRTKRPEEPTEDIDNPLAKYAWVMDDPPDWSEHIQQAFSSLADVNKAASLSSSRLLITTCPTPWQVSARASLGDGVRESCGVEDGAVYQSDLPFRQLAVFVQERGMVVCDSSRQFREATNRELLFTHNAPRLSAVGHKLYAGVVAQFLAENSHSLPPPVANGSSATERR
ncbi:MAG: Uncharacterized protein FD138_636 [Planctomycetota bacterium]|nr:MAG: Uncharacterized protein FD138_636 [Planctomycetota bacterium]